MSGRVIITNLVIVSVFINYINGLAINNTGVELAFSQNGTNQAEPDLDYSPSLFYMNNYCQNTLLLNTRNAIRVSPWTSKYPPRTTTCKMGIQNKKYPGYYLGVTFKSIKMASKKGGVCTRSRLDLFEGRSESSRARISEFSGICGDKANKEQYSTSSNFLTMLFKTEGLPHSFQNFEAIITPFHYGRCASDEFKCANSKCIKTIHLCDHYDNCGDDSDEKSCKKLLLSIAAIIGIAIGGAILISIVTVIICCCCCCASCGYERF